MKISTQSPPWAVAIVVCVGVFAISTGSIFVRLAIDAAGMQGVGFSLVISASRLSIAALLLASTWRNIAWRSLQPGAVLHGVGAGICLAFHFATWITSLSYTSIAASTTIVTTSPIWVAILAWFWLREKPSKLTLFGIAIALSGGIIIGLGEGASADISSHPILGNSLALIGAWAVAFYLMLGREAQQRGLKIGGYAAIAYTVAALVLLPLPFLFGVGYTSYPNIVYVYLILMAILPQLIGHTSFNWAVNRTSPTLVTLAILLEPVGASILAYFLFGEIPAIPVLLGAIVMIVGVAIATIGKNNTGDL
ncbi:MAG: DMT family transporter [Limnospira sp.]